MVSVSDWLQTNVRPNNNITKTNIQNNIIIIIQLTCTHVQYDKFARIQYNNTKDQPDRMFYIQKYPDWCV